MKFFKENKGLNLIIFLLVIMIFILIIYNNSNYKSNNNTSTYDISKLKEVSLSEISNKMNEKEDFILLIGRETCHACVNFIPTVLKVQKDNDFVTNYLNIGKITTESDEFINFTKSMDKVVTKGVNGKTYTDTIGNLVGWTPMIIIFEDGVAIDTSIGSNSEEGYKLFLNKYGYIKNDN